MYDSENIEAALPALPEGMYKLYLFFGRKIWSSLLK